MQQLGRSGSRDWRQWSSGSQNRKQQEDRAVDADYGGCGWLLHVHLSAD